MRIAELAAPWFRISSERYGGIKCVVAALTDRLVDRGHNVTGRCQMGGGLSLEPKTDAETRIGSANKVAGNDSRMPAA